MRTIEKLAIGAVLGGVPPISCFLAGWWISIPLVPESRIPQCALAGLVCGLLLDALLLGRWVRRAFTMRFGAWMAVYVFYSGGVFGLMGVPVFNVVLAVPAGILVGRKLALDSADHTRVHEDARRAALFTASILGLVCGASAALALVSRSTPQDLQGMLGLAFPVTTTMIIGTIVVGAATTLALDWWLTVESVERSYVFFVARPAAPNR
jgi:hypothetical protein